MLGSFCSQGYLLPKAWTLVHSNKAFQWTENHHPSSSKSRYQPFSAREFLTLIINLYITYGWIIYPLAFLHSYWEKHSCFTGKPSIHQPFSMVIFVGLLEGTLPKINRWEESSTGCLGDQATGCCKACSSMIQLSSKSQQIYCNICILCLKLGESVLDLIGF